MFSRLICIILLVVLVGQVLMVGRQTPTWQIQECLKRWIRERAGQLWPLGNSGRVRRQRPCRRKSPRPAREKGLRIRRNANNCNAAQTETIETTPEMKLRLPDIECLEEELSNYHAVYSPLFSRREQREWSAAYLNGLLLNLPNKSIESLMLALKGADPNAIRGMQHFISQGAWEDEVILKRHEQKVEQGLGDAEGVHILDSSEFPKQGKHSVGVKRQYCGQLGKVANCISGVFLGYSSRKGYTLLNRRLYLPQDWVEEEDYAERRQKCGVPQDITFKTKPELGVEMLQVLCKAKSPRSRWLTCDEAFGRDPEFLDQVDALGIWYYAEAPHNTQAWWTRPATEVPQWSGRGRRPTRERLVAGEPSAQKIAVMAQSLSADQWSRHTIKEGSKGPLVADFAALRVVTIRDTLPGPDVWLILRRNVMTGELKTYLSNAPANTSLSTLVRLSGMRWSIETCFEESKQHLGMGDFQVRSWRGWHHHMTLCILAHFFLVHIRLKFKKLAPALTLPQIHLFLAQSLPKREFDTHWAFEVVVYRQKHNYAAFISHRRRRLALLNQLE
jgi:SRSO17 transposase